MTWAWLETRVKLDPKVNKEPQEAPDLLGLLDQQDRLVLQDRQDLRDQEDQQVLLDRLVLKELKET